MFPMMSIQHKKPWIPNKPVSHGASAYHDAVVNADYYIEVLKEYIKIARDNIQENDLVIEFGAGTGVSAYHLLKNIKINFKLWLVDNSAAWLGKAYDLFKDNPNVQCYLLEKIQERYAKLSETIGEGIADKVFSANTVHLIPNIDEVFRGINEAMKPGGIFAFQSGNIDRIDRENGILMVDDTIARVHDIAIDLVKKDDRFASYRNSIEKRVSEEAAQRKFVFPTPRPVDYYIKRLKESGFNLISTQYKQIKFKYEEWMDFLRVKRLQAGILPEIGGKDPTPAEEKDRDMLIQLAAKKLFQELATTNPKADNHGFLVECVYVIAQKEYHG